jgi:phosphoribosylamine--glycine ligase
MGAIAPVPDFSQAAQEDFVLSILEPTLRGIKAEGFDYRGFIFFGLMVHADRCYLLEYNVRLGDPETQAVLPLMDFDLVDLCTAILSGKEFPLTWKPGAVCAPFAVADGYPGPYRKGDIITVDTNALEKTGAKVFISGAQLGTRDQGLGIRDCNTDDGIAPELHSNASDKNPQSPVPSPQSLLKTTGGRVLTVSAYGANAGEARANAYQGLAAVQFEGMGYRKDIGG